MEVLSNKEIFVLLKILVNKEVKENLSTTIEIDKNFSLKELEHIQHEVALSENKVAEEVLIIENTYKTLFGQSINLGYQLKIVDSRSLTNYAHKYVQELVQNNLSDLTDNNFSGLLNEFYLKVKESSTLDYYEIDEIKYMPVILCAYTNDLIEIKTISNTKYNSRRDLCSDNICFDGIKSPNSIGMVFKFEIGFTITDDNKSSSQVIESIKSNMQHLCSEISSICPSATLMTTETKKKRKKKASNVLENKYHMQPKQWKMFLCLLKVASEATKIRQKVAEISKEYLIKNGVIESNKAIDTAKTRFNQKYNIIMGNKEHEDLIYPKVSDNRYYEFNVSKVVNLYKIIKKNDYLLGEYEKHKFFLEQIVS
jgi:hypothetical protein